jgi:hypothetical protein
MTSGIANSSRINTFDIPEFTLRTPKTTEPKNDSMHIRWKRFDHAPAMHIVIWVDFYFLFTAGQGLVPARYFYWFEKHINLYYQGNLSGYPNWSRQFNFIPSRALAVCRT